MLFLIALLPLKKSVTNHVDQGWERPRGTRESVQEARSPHGGENVSKVPPGPGFRVYIDIDVVARFRLVPARPGPALAPAGLSLAVLPCNYSRI